MQKYLRIFIICLFKKRLIYIKKNIYNIYLLFFSIEKKEKNDMQRLNIIINKKINFAGRNKSRKSTDFPLISPTFISILFIFSSG